MIYPRFKKEEVPPQLQPLLETINGRIKILEEEIGKVPQERKYSPPRLQSVSEAIAREVKVFEERVEEIRKNCQHSWQKVPTEHGHTEGDLRPSDALMRCSHCNWPRIEIELHVPHS